jgi:steroid delta-isomerase-like uncharacterized protein
MPATLSLADLPAAFFLGQDRTGGPLIPELVAPTYRAEIAGFPPMDAAAHGQFGRAFYAGFPDMRHIIDEVVVADPHVTVRFTLRGTNTGAFMQIPATGKSVNVSAMALLTVEDGRVTHLRAMFDQAGMLRQLGVLPG